MYNVILDPVVILSIRRRLQHIDINTTLYTGFTGKNIKGNYSMIDVYEDDMVHSIGLKTTMRMDNVYTR